MSYSTVAECLAARASAVAYGEALALAILDRTITAAEVRDDLERACRTVAVCDDALALTRFRAGEPVAACPARAPWLGFGSGLAS